MCKVCVCQSCINTAHRNHDIDPLDKVCDEEKSNLVESAELAKEKQRSYEETIQQFESAVCELEAANIAAANQRVSQAVEEMITAIFRSERAIQGRPRQITNVKKRETEKRRAANKIGVVKTSARQSISLTVWCKLVRALASCKTK